MICRPIAGFAEHLRFAGRYPAQVLIPFYFDRIYSGDPLLLEEVKKGLDMLNEGRSWDKTAQRVVVNTLNYMDFNGQDVTPGGRERHTKDIASLIRNRWGRDVVIVQKGTRDFETTCRYGIPVIGIKSDTTTLGDIPFTLKARRIYRRGDVVLYESGENAWPFFEPSSKGVQHGIWWDGPLAGWKRALNLKRNLDFVKHMDSILCVDTNFINWLRCQGERGYCLCEKCQYVPNYAEIERIPVAPEERSSSGPLKIIYARRFVHRRGPLLFLDALAVLKGKGIDFEATLFTVGGAETLTREIADRGLEGAVHLAQADMDNVLDAYALHHVAVVPTLWSEGTSLSCVEALCAGLPVVATPVGGLGNLVIPGFNGDIAAPTAESVAGGLAAYADAGTWLAQRRNCLSLRNAFSKAVWDEKVLGWLKGSLA